MTKLVVLGGGVAAVQCIEELCRLCPDADITLVSSSRLLKGVTDIRRLTSHVEEFKVEEKDLASLPFKNLKTLQGVGSGIGQHGQKVLKLADGSEVAFDKLCICTGASPKKIVESPHVLVLRDQDTVEDLTKRLKDARRVVLVGNGGIALELSYFLQGIEVVWVLKHNHIGDAFFDIDAAVFLQTELEKSKASSFTASDPSQEHKQHGRSLFQQHFDAPTSLGMHKGVGFGHAVGPQWVSSLPIGGRQSKITLETGCEIKHVDEGINTDSKGREWPISVKLTNGKVVGADFVISAVGVAPNTGWLQGALPLAEDGGIIVDRRMETSTPGVYAAGDVCSVRREDCAPHWFQMRLWSQAKTMGAYAAHCMAGTEEEAGVSFNFELYTHVTRFLGKKVVLLGRYNGQGVPHENTPDLVSYSRSTEGLNSNFVRVLQLRGKMIGAVLIGDTELEEAFENLILDGLDLSSYGPALLDPDMDIGHIFD